MTQSTADKLTTSSPADALYEIEIGVEVSALYHDWRRGNLEFISGLVRAITLVSSVVAIALAFAHLSEPWLTAAGVVGFFAAAVALVDLVVRFDQKANSHTELFRRFKLLQAEIIRNRNDASSHIDRWAAEAETIRSEEPPVFWAIYVRGWNQALERRGVQRNDLRRVSVVQTLLGSVWTFSPNDFPRVGGTI